MTNAYDAWKAAKAALAGREIADGLRSALELSVAALREPAKIARVSELLRTYDAVQEGEPYDPTDGVWASRDGAAGEIAAALEEFEASGPAVADQRAELMERVDASLRAMKHLNYTGEHTHFEVLDDVRQVLAEVLQGRAIPMLDRFRCPSLYKRNKSMLVRCELQLPHGETHTYRDGSETTYTWTDEQSQNPPVPYETPGVEVAPPAPASVCQSFHVLQYEDGTPRNATVYCNQLAGHPGLHQSASAHQWGHPTCSAQPAEDSEIYCGREPGHKGMHSSAQGGTWPQ